MKKLVLTVLAVTAFTFADDSFMLVPAVGVTAERPVASVVSSHRTMLAQAGQVLAGLLPVAPAVETVATAPVQVELKDTPSQGNTASATPSPAEEEGI